MDIRPMATRFRPVGWQNRLRRALWVACHDGYIPHFVADVADRALIPWCRWEPME